MINRKSFDLYKDEKKTKTTERLYQPKKFRWCKYIVLPLLVGFILLLILTNVDFTGEAYKDPNFVQPVARMFLSDETFEQPNDRLYLPEKTLLGTLGQIKSSITRALNCIQSTDSCSLTCVGGNINNIYKQLEPLYKSCNRDLELILIDCSLPSGRLKSSFFQGNFRLKTVNFTNCNLAAIDSQTFVHESVKNLKNLTLINTSFVTLDATTFEGLQQMEYFHLINKISWSAFNGNGFLFNFAETLTSLVIQQESTKTYIYDPSPWLQGAIMKRLKFVNLANNNFQSILKINTFSSLIAVEQLDLSYCSLTYLEPNVFDYLLKTLKQLDLSNNHLSTLSGEMLWQMAGLELNLSFNYWLCTCDNKEMLQIIKWKLVDIKFLDEMNIRCYTPAEWRDVPVDDLVLECLVSTTLAISETTNGEITEQETGDTTLTTLASTTTTAARPQTTTTTASPQSTTTTAKTNNTTTTLLPNTTTTISSGEITSSSESSSSSSQTSEETNETSSESIETTTKLYTTTSSTTIYTSTTTRKTTTPATTTTTTTEHPLITSIVCYNNDNERYNQAIIKEKCAFSIKTISATAIKIVTNNFLSNMGVVYFYDATNYTLIPNMHRQQQEYFTIINNLNSSELYIFCLVQQKLGKLTQKYNWNISPFDCRSYSHPDVLPEPWLDKEDQIWIICLVVLGCCLLVFLGIILVVIIIRWKKQNKTKYERTSNRDLEMESNYLEPNTDSTFKNYNGLLRPSVKVYVSQHQPPDVVAQHMSCVLNHDLYEELIM